MKKNNIIASIIAACAGMMSFGHNIKPEFHIHRDPSVGSGFIGSRRSGRGGGWASNKVRAFGRSAYHREHGTKGARS